MRGIRLVHRLAACLLLLLILSAFSTTSRSVSSILSDRDLAVWAVAFQEYPPLPSEVNGISTKTLPSPIERLILNETLPSSEIRYYDQFFQVADLNDRLSTELMTRLLRRNESPVTLTPEALATFAFPFVDIMSIRNVAELAPDIIRDRFGSDNLQVLLWVSLPSFSDEGKTAAVASVRIRAFDGAEAAAFDELVWFEGRWQLGFSMGYPFTQLQSPRASRAR